LVVGDLREVKLGEVALDLLQRIPFNRSIQHAAATIVELLAGRLKDVPNLFLVIGGAEDENLEAGGEGAAMCLCDNREPGNR